MFTLGRPRICRAAGGWRLPFLLDGRLPPSRWGRGIPPVPIPPRASPSRLWWAGGYGRLSATRARTMASTIGAPRQEGLHESRRLVVVVVRERLDRRCDGDRPDASRPRGRAHEAAAAVCQPSLPALPPRRPFER